ncbi:TPA: efflux transporter outer membrane subunit [Legionella pneumophila]|uniref:efflux transporter outer membrane subunit n=1 Tax=Legionella pneumophila TaxID=446 RepID=UPI000D080594|nr:efflux transporter outer membrane subunit [Legionella pneumophila]HAU1636796.1 efflux transporter outer membrane subunit [Legionella pneumophila]HAU1683960.1 efflux transporter outer membrane subunit [Legionella pneumophila]
MFRKRWLILLCVLLNNGCFLLGPEYRKPPVNVPQKWPHNYSIQTKQTAYLPDLYWWEQFNSQELNAFIQKALQNNHQIHLAMANIESAQSQLQQIQLNWLPNLTALAGYSQFPVLGNPGTTVIAYPAYIINIFQQYKQQKSAQAMLEASIYAQYSARLVVIAQTSASFFTLVAQNEALHLYNKLLKDYRTYLKLTQSQYRSGLISLDNITQIKSHIQRIEAQIQVVQHNIVVSKNALHFLFNENPGDVQIKALFENIDSNQLIPGNLPASVLSMRPDIHEAEALLKAAHADVGAITANLLPGINLGAFLGEGSNVDGAIKLGQAYLNGPIIDLPLFAQIDVSKARYKAIYIKYITTIREALRDVANDLSAYSAYSQQLNNNKLALSDEKQRCHLAEVRYRHGIDDYLHLIKCQILLDEFKLMINQNKLEKLLSMVTLYQDLGGGYHGH